MNCYSPNFQGFILMKNALNNQVGMLGDMFLWLVANLKQGVIYFIKQALPPNISAGSVGVSCISSKYNVQKRAKTCKNVQKRASQVLSYQKTCISSSHMPKNVQKRAKRCISNVFGPYSKRCIVKVLAS